MSETVLTACLVPWSISPTTSGLTLTHGEGDSSPACTVVLGAGRLGVDGRTDDRRVEIAFDSCYYVRVGPHSDTEGIESIGYAVISPFESDPMDYLSQRARLWRESGYCPNPGFYVARQSAWLVALPEPFHRGFRHYVIDGRDGYVEVIARGYRWREWHWHGGERESAPTRGPVVGEGESAA